MTDDLHPHPALRQAPIRYGLAALFVVAAASVRIWPLQGLGSGLAWVTFYPAVMVASLYGGLSAGLVTTALSCLVVRFGWPLLVAQPFLQKPADYLGMAVFALTGAFIARVAGALLTSNARARRNAQALAESEHFITTIAHALPGMVAYWDRDLRCRFANEAYQEWFGQRPLDMVGKHLREVVGEELFALNQAHVRGALAGEKQQFERILTKPDGTQGHLLTHYIPDFGKGREVAGYFVLGTDVTPLKKAEARLMLAASVYNNTVEGILVTDEDQVILSVNPAFTSITGYSYDEAVGQKPRILKSNRHEPEFYAAMWRDLATKGRWQGEIWNRRKGGEAYLEWLTITKVPGAAGEPMRYVSVFNDITESRRDDERVKYLAFHDALTDLPNRSLLLDRMEHQIAKAEREHSALALLFLDLDRFKDVNDRLGHDVGDELLREVARKLQALVRHADTVARLGGDEFVILLDCPSTPDEAVQIATRVLATVNEPMAFRGQSVQVGTAVGIAMFPADGRTPSELMKSADMAMYAAKGAGGNTYCFHKTE